MTKDGKSEGIEWITPLPPPRKKENTPGSGPGVVLIFARRMPGLIFGVAMSNDEGRGVGDPHTFL